MEREPPRLLDMPGLPGELLRAALEDAAPSDVRRGVLAALGMAIDGSAPSAQPGEVTTLSGVFEKNPPGSERTFAWSTPVRTEPVTTSRVEQRATRPRPGVTKRGSLGPVQRHSTALPSSPSTAPSPGHLQPTELLTRHLPSCHLPPPRLPRLSATRIQHATSLLYVAVAAAAGALIARAAHLALPSGVPGEVVGSSAALTCDCPSSPAMLTLEDTLSAAAAGIAGEPARAGEPRRSSNARGGEPRAPSSRGRGPAAPPRRDGAGEAGPLSPAAKALRFDGAALARFATSALHDADVAPEDYFRLGAEVSEDWLGDQLALLARAERSLLEHDPDETLRSFEEYRARFPQGLLDPQMAAVRQRAEQRFGALIFP